MAATLNAQLTLNSAQFQGGLNRAVISANAAVSQMSAQFSGLKNIAGLGAIGGVFITLGQKVLEATINFEKYHRQLTIVSGGSQAATVKLRELQTIASLPGLNMESAVYGQVRLQAMGYAADQATEHVKTLAKNVAAFGGGGEEMKGILLAFSQISSKGQVFAEEINQIAERLPLVRRLMTDAFGTSNTEEIQKMGISATQFTDALLNGMQNAQPVTAGVAEEISKLKVLFESLFADESGGLALFVSGLTEVVKGFEGLRQSAISFYTDLFTNDEALANLNSALAFNAEMQEKLSTAQAERDKKEADIADARKKRAAEIKKEQEDFKKAMAARVTQTGLQVSAAGTDEEKLAVINAELKILNLTETQEKLIKKLNDAQAGRVKLSELEIEKIQRYLGYLGQRKSLEESIAADKRKVDEEKAREEQKEKDRKKRLAKMTQSVREKGEALGFGRKTEEEQAVALKKALGGKTLENVMEKLNEAKEAGKELDEAAIEDLEKQIELLKDLDAAEANFIKQKDAAQKEVDKEMVNNAMERAGMGRSQRVSAMREKNDLERQKGKATRALTRELMENPNEALSKEMEKARQGRRVGDKDNTKALAKAEAERIMAKAMPDAAASLRSIKTILENLAAA